MPSGRRLGILISGRGSNLQAIADAIGAGRLDATIAVVVSSRGEAAGLDRARAAGVDAVVVPARDYRDRDAYDRAVVEVLRARTVDLVCLAGFMRLVGAPLLDAYPHRILNIHPSLLPAFPGLDAQRQALEYGVQVSGCTVHFVDDQLDHGVIVLQRTVKVAAGDDEATLNARILEQEHLAYPEAIARVLSGNYRIAGRRYIPR
ncbi:MAG: phosphoribosylglycinamide formyltransferase [Acetobacteraceae bacterium]